MKSIKKFTIFVGIIFLFIIFELVITVNAEFNLDYSYTVDETIFTDSFDYSFNNWIVEKGNTWVVENDLNNNFVSYSYPGINEGILIGLEENSSLVNLSYSADFRINDSDGPNAKNVGLIFRYTDYNNMYMLRFFEYNNAVELLKKDNGQWSIVSSKVVSSTVLSNEWHNLKIEAINNHFIGYFDDEMVIQYSDLETDFIYKGNFGIRVYQNNVSIDNVEVKKINTDVVVSDPSIDDRDPNEGRNYIDSIENDEYILNYFDNFSFQLINKETNSVGEFLADFTVIRGKYPNKGITKEDNYTHISWNGDTNLYSAPGTYEHIIPISQEKSTDNSELIWTFLPQEGYTFEAKISLKDGLAPELEYTLNSTTDNIYYSIGYTGVFEYSIETVDWIFLPPHFSGKRNVPYLIDESRISLPVAMYSVNNSTVAITPNPDKLYDEYKLVTTENAKYGLAIQDENDKIKPQYFAPIYGGENSKITDNFTSYINLFVNDMEQFELYKDIAYNHFDFSDYRENRDFTLNDTLNNLVNLILNSSGDNYIYWDPNTKTYEYINDKPGYGRQQSMIYALGIALVTDNYQMYENRALPTIEYMISRATQYMKIEGNSFDPDYQMGGPVEKTFVDFASLYEMTGKTNNVYKDLAIESFTNYVSAKGIDDIYNIIDLERNYSLYTTDYNFENYVPGLLAMYTVTDDDRFLNQAIKAADAYIQKRVIPGPTDFSTVEGPWPFQKTPYFDILEEMYYATGDEKYIQAAATSMQEFITMMHVTPTIPDGTINIRGQEIPAWVVSDIGLIHEQGNTSGNHRGIMMPYMDGYLERYSEWANEEFFSDLARSNIVGRYANYPGYAVRNEYDIAYYDANYPLQDYSNFVNTAHMNHPVPMASMIIDYLVSDVFNRSNKEIVFPSVYTRTSAYFNSQVVVGQNGTFYGNENVNLWMPQDLLSTSNKQFNYISGYDDNNIYLSFSNQSFNNEQTIINLNSELVNFASTNEVTIWYEDGTTETKTMENGSITIEANSKGLTSLKIHDASPVLYFQSDFYARRDSSTHEYASLKTTEEDLGIIGAYFITDSQELNTFYMYSDLTPNETTSVTFYYSVDDGETWKQGKDSRYPYEFSVPLYGNETKIDYYIVDSNNNISNQYWIWVSDELDPPTREDYPFEPPISDDTQTNDDMSKIVYDTDFAPSANEFIADYFGDKFVIDVNTAGEYYLKPNNSKIDTTALFGGNWDDLRIKVDFSFDSKSYGPTGIIFRAIDENNYYMVQFVQATNTLRIIKVVNGVFYDLINPINVSMPILGKNYELMVQMENEKITVYFNENYLTEVTDSDNPYQSGRIGLRTYNSKIEVNNLEVSLLLYPEEEPVYNNDFTNGKPNDWQFSDSNWVVEEIDNNPVLVYHGAGSSIGYALFGEENLSNYSVKVKLNYQDFSQYIKSGIIIRYQDENNYYLVRGFDDAGGEFQLIKVTDGAFKILDSTVIRSLAKNIWYDLELRALDNRIEFYLNDELKIYVEDDAFTNGKAGIYVDYEDVFIKDVTISKYYYETLVESLEFEEDSYVINLDDSINIAPNILPEDSDNAGIYWIIEDPTIISVDEEGNITPLKEGSTIVYAFSYSEYNYDSVNIQVTNIVETPEDDIDNEKGNNNLIIYISGIAIVVLGLGSGAYVIIKRKVR